MAKKPRDNDKDTGWKSFAVKVGVIAGVLGIITSSINIAAALRARIGEPPINADLERQVSESAPRLDVSYVSMSSELYSLLKERGSQGAQAQNIFLAFPVVSNEVANGDLSFSNEILNTDEVDDENTEERITCLVIQNKGKREALDVSLNVNRMNINGVVAVREIAGGASEDYEAKFLEKMIGATETSFALPVSLETGAGVLVPLFITRNPHRLTPGNRRAGWSLISKIAYLPKSITFTDPLGQGAKNVAVRKMRAPIRLDNGVEIRG